MSYQITIKYYIMKALLKESIKHGKTVVFDNETTYTDTYLRMEVFFVKDCLNQWVNGYRIEFNGKSFIYKTFTAFFKKVSQLKNDFSLQLKSW